MCVWAAYTSQLVSSSPVGAPEAIPEPAPNPEVVPEPPIFLVSPEMAERAVFTFYVLAVLRAWKTHMLASDHGPVCWPEPVADPEAVPEQHVLLVMTTDAIPESAPAPGPPEFTSKPWNYSKESLVPILKAGQTHAHYIGKDSLGAVTFMVFQRYLTAIRTYFTRWLIHTNSYDLTRTISYDLSKPH